MREAQGGAEPGQLRGRTAQVLREEKQLRFGGGESAKAGRGGEGGDRVDAEAEEADGGAVRQGKTEEVLRGSDEEQDQSKSSHDKSGQAEAALEEEDKKEQAEGAVREGEMMAVYMKIWIVTILLRREVIKGTEL